MAYIYVITNQINGKQYVGKTLYTIEARFKEHCLDSKTERCKDRPLYRAFNKYGIDNFNVMMLEECSDKIANDREIYWIDKLNTYHNGYNATLGGEGTQKYDHNQIKQLLLLNPYPCKVAEEVGCCVDLVREIAKANDIPIKNYSQEVFAQQKSKIVYQYDLNGVFVQQFSSLAEAGEWLFNNNYCRKYNSGVRSHISDAARGKRKTAYNFIWKYTLN